TRPFDRYGRGGRYSGRARKRGPAPRSTKAPFGRCSTSSYHRSSTRCHLLAGSGASRRELGEPLNRSRVAATEAFRDEMHEATRSPWRVPWASGATQQIARKASSLRV